MTIVLQLVYTCIPMKFTSFENMNLWQEARILMREIRTICKKTHVSKDFAWVDQITRSSLSIQSNIAEGLGSQSNAVFIQFLGHSRRSSYEVRSQLYYAFDENYISAEEFAILMKRIIKITSMLSSLISYLQKHIRQKRECFNQKLST